MGVIFWGTCLVVNMGCLVYAIATGSGLLALWCGVVMMVSAHCCDHALKGLR